MVRHAADAFMFSKITPAVQAMTRWWQNLSRDKNQKFAHERDHLTHRHSVLCLVQ